MTFYKATFVVVYNLGFHFYISIKLSLKYCDYISIKLHLWLPWLHFNQATYANYIYIKLHYYLSIQIHLMSWLHFYQSTFLVVMTSFLSSYIFYCRNYISVKLHLWLCFYHAVIYKHYKTVKKIISHLPYLA